MRLVVSDSSTLIHLSVLRRLELLRSFFGVITIPPAVWAEVVSQGEGRVGSVEVQTARHAGWVRVESLKDSTVLPLLRQELDEGEAEVIALAVAERADLVLLDETEGRRIAGLYDVPVTGTIGILLRAKREGMFTSMRDELEALQHKGGFWIAEHLFQSALRAAGE